MAIYVDVSTEREEVCFVRPGQRRTYLTASFALSSMTIVQGVTRDEIDQIIEDILSNVEMRATLISECGSLLEARKFLEESRRSNANGSFDLLFGRVVKTKFVAMVSVDFNEHGIRKTKFKPFMGLHEGQPVTFSQASEFVHPDVFDCRPNTGRSLNFSDFQTINVSPENARRDYDPGTLAKIGSVALKSSLGVTVPYLDYAGKPFDAQVGGVYHAPLSLDLDLSLRHYLPEFIRKGELSLASEERAAQDKFKAALWKIERRL